MKLNEPKNKNYAAVVVRLKNIIPLESCDNLVATTIFGFQAIVGKEHKVGDIGVVFPAETQLSKEFCSANNLYRHKELNKEDKAGYLEDNRRVKAVKFRGNTSSCLFMPLDCFDYLGTFDLKEGDEFDELNGNMICKKYIIREPREFSNKMSGQKKVERVELKHMPEHFDTDNFWKNIDKVGKFERCYITQKLHGTSIRVGYTLANRNLTMIEKVAKFFGARIQEKQYELVCASRKVIKGGDSEYQHYYETDIWTTEGKKLEGLLPKNYILYGELIGFTDTGAPIQKDYTYNVQEGCDLYVYRIAVVNEDGHITDLDWNHIKQFCVNTGLKYVPEMSEWVPDYEDEDPYDTRELVQEINELVDNKYSEEYTDALTLSNPDTVDEGVCVRFEGNRLTPYILKAKSPKFFEWETKQLDTGNEDIESSQN